MNYINYIQHSIFTPNTIHRRFDLDLPRLEETTKRIALAVLPFISLYRPAGFALSVAMNASRTVSHLQNACRAEDHKQWTVVGLEAGKASLAALSLSSSFFRFTSACLITTGFDALQGASNTCHALWQGEYAKSTEEALQTLASAAYLGFMITGALEAMVAFALLQAACSLYQARSEFWQGRYLEGTSKLALAALRLNQVNQYVGAIRKRNAFMELQKTRDLFFKILRGKQASHLIRHPLSSLQERIESKEVVFTDHNGNDLSFGSHFHGNGQAIVKGENLAFRKEIVDGKEMIELDFKVNHAFREKIDEALQQLKNVNLSDMKEILALAGSHAAGISVGSGSFFKASEKSMFFEIGQAHKIQIEGLGTILIGSQADQPNLYDRVVVRIDANQTFYELHEMLSLIDLDKALCLSTQDDIDRLKMGHLFRTFCPREATPFERTEEFFALSPDQLKAKMIEKAPQMKEIFDSYYHRMQEEPLFDGRIRYRIQGLAEAAYEQGGRALTAAIVGVYKDKDLYDRVASMLRMGMISTEIRHENLLGQHGLGGSGDDYFSGGADSVFTQLLTEKDVREKLHFDDLAYKSKVRMIISLDALEMGTYQYHRDNFGNRVYDKTNLPWAWFLEPYASRGNILEFIQKEQMSAYGYRSNEVMLKERIAPSFFKGLVVPNEQTKLELVAHLRGCGLVKNNEILDMPIDCFVRVGTQVSEDLL